MNVRLSQLLTLILAAACGIFLLLIVLFEFGFGRGYRWWPLDSDGSLAGTDLGKSSFKLPAWEAFADVNARPLFNEDRKPTPPAPPETTPTDAKPIPKLNVVLSGVIITSKVRMVMIKENGKVQSTTVKEGSALAGDLGAWSLARIKPRSAVFKNTAGDEVTVELIAAAIDQKPTPPANPPAAPIPPMVPPVAQQGPGIPNPGSSPDAPPGKPQDQASADLQQRIDARRQQLREQNERGKQPPQQQR